MILHIAAVGFAVAILHAIGSFAVVNWNLGTGFSSPFFWKGRHNRKVISSLFPTPKLDKYLLNVLYGANRSLHITFVRSSSSYGIPLAIILFRFATIVQFEIQAYTENPWLIRLTSFLNVATQAAGRTSFYNSTLIQSDGLITADQSGLVIDEESLNLFSYGGILVRWQADSAFQTKSCQKKENLQFF